MVEFDLEGSATNRATQSSFFYFFLLKKEISIYVNETFPEISLYSYLFFYILPVHFFIPLSNGVKNYLQSIHIKSDFFCSQFSGRTAPWEKKSNQVLFHILPTNISKQITFITGPRVKKVSFTIQLNVTGVKLGLQ